jgi:membrane protease YdiL (CAAX protease family)
MDLDSVTQQGTASAPAVEPVVCLPPQKVMDSMRKIELLLLLGITIAPFIARAISLYILYRGVWPNSPLPSYASFSMAINLVHEVGGLGLLLYILLRQGRSLRDIGFSFRWTDIPIGVGLMVLSCIAAMVGRFFANLIYISWTDRTVAPWNGGTALLGTHVSILLVVFLVVNAFFEELIVRAYFTSELMCWKNNAALAGVMSVLVQALYHIYQGVPNMISAAALFTVYAIYYAKTRRILPIIVSHFLVDAVIAWFFFSYRV